MCNERRQGGTEGAPRGHRGGEWRLGCCGGRPILPRPTPSHSHELVKRARRIGGIDPQYKSYAQGSAHMRRVIIDDAGGGYVTGGERECVKGSACAGADTTGATYRRARPMFCCDATERKRMSLTCAGSCGRGGNRWPIYR